MRLVVAAVGRSSRTPLAAAVAEYEERAGRYFDLEVIRVPPAGPGPEDRVREEEARALVSRVPDDLEWLALTRRGKGMSSRGLARYLGELQTYGRAGAVFLIGGAHGLGEEVLGRARYRLSLSPMTLPHEIARLILAEQLYRAGTIIRGEPYHKDRTAE